MQTSWAQQELQTVRLGDKRLHPRLFAIVDTLAQHPEAPIPEAFGSWAATKAFYRFCSSDNVATQDIARAHRQQTVARASQHPRILAIQDTTDFDFTTHRATTGLGPINATESQGFKLHSVLAATDTGVPLGLLAHYVWSRNPDKAGQSRDWRKRPLTEKETLYWYFGLSDSHSFLPETTEVICICDRQGDCFDLLSAPRPPHSHLLVRAAYDRRVDLAGQKLFATLEAVPVAGIKTLRLRPTPQRPERDVELSVRFATLTLQPPSYCKDLAEVQVQAVLAQEQNPPAGVKPLRWLLLTTCAVDTFAAACQMLDWYACRWLIERYHFVLKSGCHLEALQLSTRARLQVALALYHLVAWRLLFLTYQARKQPEQSCEPFLSRAEWQALYCQVHRTPTPPQQPPCLREAVFWIARLGGFLARTRDGEPGVKVLWRGLRRLQGLTEMWQLLHDPNCG
jgi:hypothetical protein